MGLLPLPRRVRRDDQAVPQHEPETQVDGHVRLAEAPDNLSFGPANE